MVRAASLSAVSQTPRGSAAAAVADIAASTKIPIDSAAPTLLPSVRLTGIHLPPSEQGHTPLTAAPSLRSRLHPARAGLFQSGNLEGVPDGYRRQPRGTGTRQARDRRMKPRGQRGTMAVSASTQRKIAFADGFQIG